MLSRATGCKLALAAFTSVCLIGFGQARAANVTLFQGDGNFFGGAPGGFAFDAFTGNVTESPTSLTVDVSAFGGLGRDVTPVDFDADTHQLRIVYRTLANNAANDYRIILRDNDGDDSAPGQGSEDYQFFVDMSFASPLNDGSGFSEQFVPLTESGNPVFRQQAFGFSNDGDTVLNFGLDQWQLQSAFGGTDRLNIEMQLIEIVPIPEPGALGLAAVGLAALLMRRGS